MFNFLPYKTYGSNNKIIIVKNGKKQELKHKIRGLTIDIAGNNNYVEIEFPTAFEKTLIKMRGNEIKFIMKKTSSIMKDVFFDLENYAEVYIGEDSRFNTKNTWICVNNNITGQPHKLVIGKNAQMGANLLIRTADGHSLFNDGEELPYNEPQDVIIGDDVWVATNCTILKGAVIPSNTVVGASSVVTKKFTEEGTILAGNPAKVIRKNISWKRKPYGPYIDMINRQKNGGNTQSEKQVLIKKLKRKIKKAFNI